MPRVDGTRGTTTPATSETDHPGRIVMAYGIRIRDKFAGFKASINNGIGLIKTGLEAGSFVGNEAKDAKGALRHLEKALSDLTIPGGKLPRNEKDSGKSRPAFRPPSGGIHAMYGIWMRDNLAELRSSIGTMANDMDATIKSGTLKGDDLRDAKQARIDLKNALHHLTPAKRD